MSRGLLLEDTSGLGRTSIKRLLRAPPAYYLPGALGPRAQWYEL